MSISHLRKSRGFSIVAALVAVALLTLLAVAIQSTIPATVSPASMSASVSSADTISTSGSSAPASSSSVNAPASNAPVKPGYDVATLLFSDKPQQDLYVPVCPQVLPDASAKTLTFIQQAQKLAVYNNAGANKFGDPTGRCKQDPKNASRKVPIDANIQPWQQWSLYCQYKGTPTGAAGAKVAPRDITDSDVDFITPKFSQTTIECKVVPPGVKTAGTSGTSKTPAQIDKLVTQLQTASPEERAALLQGLNSSDQSALDQALTSQGVELRTTTDNLKAENENLDSQIQSLSNECALNGTGVCDNAQLADLTAKRDANQQAIDANESAIKNLAAADKEVALAPPAGGSGQSGCASESCVGGQLGDDRTNSAPTPQGPCPNGGVVDASGNCPSTGKPPPGGTTFSQPGAGTINGGNPSGGGGLGNILGRLFGGGGNNNASNYPQSPFGGACNTRYVCQGNALYYQTPQYVSYNPIIVQCITQPVQQCPYGCMAMNNGINGANGTNGSGSFLSDFGTGLQIASQLMRVFGGGGSNNALANNNLSSQCAMTPQQAQGYQSPYGTGSDGQPCAQPPAQPDPAQCSSGTWKQTSANQNGCVTGYQCVPNNPTATNPSAQLSCQPQIADVGTPISFSFSCGNSDASKGSGFSTGGALSGATTTPAPVPPSGTNQATFTLTCLNQGVTASAQCQVQLNRPGIVLVTNPKKVHSGESSLVGWVTAGMQSCAISSPDDQDFTARNAGNTNVNGAATTSPITSTTNFRLDCQTLSGGTKTATTSVSVN